MPDSRPQILMVFDQRVHEHYLPPEEIKRLAQFADWSWFSCAGGGIYQANEDTDVSAHLGEHMVGAHGMVVCHGAPLIDGALMDRAPNLRFIGELEGDRFASRIDLEAAWERNIRVVDTTQGSSYPVAEWALGLILVSLKNAGAMFRRMIAGEAPGREKREAAGMLYGKRVGVIGCGHMARRLIKFLRPFEADIWVCDPYIPRELPEALGVLQTSLDQLMSQCDVIVCMAPLTPKTRGMIGSRELDLIRSGSVFVNVSRGAIVDSGALIDRLRRGDITAGLDVFDPEPVPSDSEIRHLPNVFLSPHIGGTSGTSHPHFFRLMVDELERFFQGHETWFDLTPRSLGNRRGDEPV